MSPKKNNQVKVVHSIYLNEMTVAIIGLIIILILSFTALVKGLDGVMFGSSMAGIGAIIGWVFKNFRDRVRK